MGSNLVNSLLKVCNICGRNCERKKQTTLIETHTHILKRKQTRSNTREEKISSYISETKYKTKVLRDDQNIGYRSIANR